MAQPQGDVVVGGEDGVGQTAVEQAPGDLGPGLSRPGVRAHPAAGNPGLCARRLVGGQALRGVLPGQVPGDVQQAAAPLIQKMLRGQPGSQGLVDGDGGQLGELVLPRDDDHDRTAVALGREDGQDVGALGQDHDGRHAVTVQVSQRLSHGLRVAALGSGQDEGVPPLAHRPGDRGEGGGHPVRQPGRQQDAHGPGGSRGQ